MHPLDAGWGFTFGIVFLRHGAPISGVGAGRPLATHVRSFKKSLRLALCHDMSYRLHFQQQYAVEYMLHAASDGSGLVASMPALSADLQGRD